MYVLYDMYIYIYSGLYIYIYVYFWGFFRQIQVLLGWIFPSLLNMLTGGLVLGEA